MHAPVARPNREKGGSEADGTRFGCETGACAYGFKTLRVSRVLSTQLVGNVKSRRRVFMWAVSCIENAHYIVAKPS